MKILFIDDEYETEVLFNAVQARHLSDKVVLADDLKSAREKLWSEKFDVIVLDIMMPADDEAVPGSSDEAGLIAGLLLIELAQKDKDCVNGKTPIIILTGLTPSEHDSVATAQKTYGKYFLTKPEHPDALYEAISNAVKN